MADAYFEPQVITTDKFIIRIHRPILTEEERARRMQQIKDATASLLHQKERQANEKQNLNSHQHTHGY